MEKNIIRNENIIFFEFCSGNYGDYYFFFRKTENNGR